MSYTDPYNPVPRPTDRPGDYRRYPRDPHGGTNKAVYYWLGAVGLLVLGFVLFGSIA